MDGSLKGVNVKNIDKLESKFPDEHKSIIDAFKATKILNTCYSGKVLDEN